MPGRKNRVHWPLERSGSCCWYVLLLGSVGKEKNLGSGVAEFIQQASQKPWVLLRGAGWSGLSVMGRWDGCQGGQCEESLCGMCPSSLGTKEKEDICLGSPRDRWQVLKLRQRR